MLKRIALLSLLLALPGVALYAQGEPQGEDCTAGAYADLISDYAVFVGESPDEEIGVLLSDLVAEISTRRAACAGLVFEGTGDQVVPLVTIPSGAYIVHMTSTEGYTRAELQHGEGECGANVVDMTPLVNVSGDNAETESLFRTEDECAAVLTVESRGEWMLEFTPVDMP